MILSLDKVDQDVACGAKMHRKNIWTHQLVPVRLIAALISHAFLSAVHGHRLSPMYLLKLTQNKFQSLPFLFVRASLFRSVPLESPSL